MDRPFKPHLKLVHELIIYIIMHDTPYGVFISYEGVRALSIPADTRFATELICVRSLMADKEQVQKLFIDPAYEAWFAKQSPDARAKVRSADRIRRCLCCCLATLTCFVL